MQSCKIIIKDEVNIKIEGLDLSVRKKLESALKFMQPHAYHVPSYKLGRWDGCIRFFNIGGSTYINALPVILPILEEEGYSIDIDDQRTKWNFEFKEITNDYFSNKTWPAKHPKEFEPIELFDHQREVINHFLKDPQCVQEIATSAGKTIITAGLSNIVEKYGRSMVIVPNKDLVVQTETDYKNLGLDVGVYYGDRKEYGKMHTICTWQSLEVIKKNFRDGKNEMSLDDFAKDVVCIIVDETHRAKSDVLRDLLIKNFGNIPIRWGLTGTIPESEVDKWSIKIALGETINALPAHVLQEKGLIANCDISIIQTHDDVFYDNYQSEMTYLTTDPRRLDQLADAIRDISQTGNTLVLVDRIKAGKGLMERLPDDAVFISGSTKQVDRKEEYDKVADSTNKIIVATYGVAAVGINIPRIFNLVLIEPGKSFVRVIQSIGRGIRKAKDKDHVKIWDITSDAKFSKRHLTKRKKFYKDAKYPFKVNKVDYPFKIKTSL